MPCASNRSGRTIGDDACWMEVVSGPGRLEMLTFAAAVFLLIVTPGQACCRRPVWGPPSAGARGCSMWPGCVPARILSVLPRFPALRR